MKSVTIKGKQVKKITLNGGTFFEKIEPQPVHTKLEYATFSNAYVSSGFIPVTDSGKSEFVVRPKSDIWNSMFWGVNSTAGWRNSYYIGFASKKWFAYYGFQVDMQATPVDFENFSTVSYNRLTATTTVNGDAYERNSNTPSQTEIPLLGNVLNNLGYQFKGDIAAYREYDDSGNLLLNMYAVLKSDGVVAMYDEISNTYQYSLTDNPLIAGTPQAVMLQNFGIIPNETPTEQQNQLNEMGVG